MATVEMDLASWERGPDEHPRRWEAFSEYRNMGPARSLAKVAQRLGKSVQLLHRWSSEDHWVERVEAWDREEDRLWRLEQAQKRREAAERHADMAVRMLEKVDARLGKLTATDIKKMTILQLARLAEVGVKVERLALGETTENVHHDGALDVTGSIDLARRVIDDPDAAEAALSALDRISAAS